MVLHLPSFEGLSRSGIFSAVTLPKLWDPPPNGMWKTTLGGEHWHPTEIPSFLCFGCRGKLLLSTEAKLPQGCPVVQALHQNPKVRLHERLLCPRPTSRGLQTQREVVWMAQG